MFYLLEKKKKKTLLLKPRSLLKCRHFVGGSLFPEGGCSTFPHHSLALLCVLQPKLLLKGTDQNKQGRRRKKHNTHIHPRFFPLPSFKLILLSLSSFVSSNMAQLLAHLRAQGAPTQSPAAWFGSLHPEQSTEIALQPWLPTPILTSYGPQKAFQ